VIGAGVSGLTTGICLAEAGLGVLIRAERPPHRTTSAAAGALWGAHLVEASDRSEGWALRTLAELERLAGGAPASSPPVGGTASAVPPTGVRIASGVLAARTQTAQPRWADAHGGFRACAAGELPAGYKLGWRFSAPLVDKVVGHRVGPRPVRPKVRAEAQHLPGGSLLCYNYGHGGAGITLSWGCARDIADVIITELL